MVEYPRKCKRSESFIYIYIYVCVCVCMYVCMYVLYNTTLGTENPQPKLNNVSTQQQQQQQQPKKKMRNWSFKFQVSAICPSNFWNEQYKSFS